LILTLSGCELLAAGQLMPGLAPGVGKPLEGEVVDGRTRLPVGGATVVSGLGSTTTDANGRFKLYGGLNSREVSVCRAGYTAMTLGGLEPEAMGNLQFVIQPQFPTSGSLPKRFLELSGQVTGLPAGQDGLVSLGELTSSVSNGGYQIRFESEVPGKVITSVLGWGAINGRYQENASAPQPFNFTTFSYRVEHWALGDTYPQAKVGHAPLAIANDVAFQKVKVAYTNLAGFTGGVQTDILLDFGVAGSVPVARALGSNQEISVPQIPGLKYVIQGEARDPSGRSASVVNITTNDPSKATFQLLGAPKVLSPTPGASGTGQKPQFSWSSTGPQDQVVYVITLYEGDKNSDSFDSKPKWIAQTSDTDITFPPFSVGDINGGALRPETMYTWVLRAVDVLEAPETPTSKRSVQDVAPVKPFRVRQRESETRGNTFTL
jgi:hypothetical protein